MRLRFLSGRGGNTHRAHSASTGFVDRLDILLDLLLVDHGALVTSSGQSHHEHAASSSRDNQSSVPLPTIYP